MTDDLLPKPGPSPPAPSPVSGSCKKPGALPVHLGAGAPNEASAGMDIRLGSGSVSRCARLLSPSRARGTFTYIGRGAKVSRLVAVNAAAATGASSTTSEPPHDGPPPVHASALGAGAAPRRTGSAARSEVSASPTATDSTRQGKRRADGSSAHASLRRTPPTLPHADAVLRWAASWRAVPALPSADGCRHMVRGGRRGDHRTASEMPLIARRVARRIHRSLSLPEVAGVRRLAHSPAGAYTGSPLMPSDTALPNLCLGNFSAVGGFDPNDGAATAISGCAAGSHDRERSQCPLRVAPP